MKSDKSQSVSLYRKIVLPVFIMIIVLVSIFCITAGTIIISLQNKNTMSMVEQSMGYAYRSISYRFNSIGAFISMVTVNKEVDRILSRNSSSYEDIVADFYVLYDTLQNISLLSLKSDIGGGDTSEFSYNISIISESDNALEQIAALTYSATSGLYSSQSVKNREWYEKMAASRVHTIWWKEEVGGNRYIYYASRKKSTMDGRDLGIITLALNVDNLSNILGKEVTGGEGYYLLVDENMEVVYSKKHDFGVNVKALDFMQNVEGGEGVFTHKIDGANHIVMFNTLNNGWRLISVVPEKNIKGYTGSIVCIGALAGLVSILLAGFVIRKAANAVRTPISTLVDIMAKAEIEGFSGNWNYNTDIDEISKLYRGYNFLISRINELIRDVYVKDIERKQLQLNLLQSQINPHFLYNTLDIINCMAISRKAKDISLVVKSLANVFRYGLNRGREMTLLKDELKQVSSYLEIQKVMDPQLSYEVKAEEGILDASVLNLILQPFVENSIIHGFKNKAGERDIRISVCRLDGKLIIDILDNGVGIKVDKYNSLLENTGQEAAGSGYGVLNVNKRIRLYFGENYGILYMPVENGTCVRMTLPFRVGGSSSQ